MRGRGLSSALLLCAGLALGALTGCPAPAGGEDGGVDAGLDAGIRDVGPRPPRTVSVSDFAPALGVAANAARKVTARIGSPTSEGEASSPEHHLRGGAGNPR